jgi:WD40 repeat protein
MNIARSLLLVLFLPALLFAQTQQPGPQASVKPFPRPDFILRDKNLKPPKSGVVLGPAHSDGKGGSTGSFASYGGSSMIQVGSLSFSGDGKILAVGSTPGRVDLWDVPNRKKLRTLSGGTTIALSADGRLVAMDSNGIELCEVATGKLVRRIPKELKTFKGGAQNTIQKLVFNPAGTLLDVAANGEEDSIYDVFTGQLVVTLTNTQRGQFSADGALLIGGNVKHLIVWNTNDWSKVSDLPAGPDYATRIAAFPQKDFIIFGGPKVARLLRLSTGEELAKVGTGYTNFVGFDQSGSIIFTYTSSGFGVWDTSGKEYCFSADIGNGTVALSSDGRWLAGAPVNGLTSVMVWNLRSALGTCGAPSALQPQ